MIITNMIDLPWKFTYLSANTAKEVGRQFNSPVRMFRYKSLLAAYKVNQAGMIQYRKDLTMGAVQDENFFPKDGKDHYYNAYCEEITEDLSKVTPFFFGKFKDGIHNYVTIQADKITSDNWVIVQFPDNKAFNVFRQDITSIYLGALPNFRIKSFVKIYNELDWESVNYLLVEMGLKTELEPIAKTICEMDLRFTEGDYEWLKSQ